MRLRSLVLWLSLSACNIDPNKIDSNIVGACGISLEDLANQNTISADCRAAIESLLPQPEENVRGRMLVLGAQMEVDGASIVVAAVDEAAVPVKLSASGTLQVSVTRGGTTEVLPAGAFEVHGLGSLTVPTFSIGFVTDYSGSMTTQDIMDASALSKALVNTLPPIFEAEVVIFSKEVSRKLAFTDDRNQILAALEVDSNFKRESTALYDAMATSLGNLGARTRPVKILVTTTDGRENSSKTFKKEDVLAASSRHGVFTVMLGGLFADTKVMKELTEPNGAFAYARSVRAATEAAMVLVQAIGEGARVRVLPPHHMADSITLQAGDLQATAPMAP
jgi:hypothetical protein